MENNAPNIGFRPIDKSLPIAQFTRHRARLTGVEYDLNSDVCRLILNVYDEDRRWDVKAPLPHRFASNYSLSLLKKLGIDGIPPNQTVECDVLIIHVLLGEWCPRCPCFKESDGVQPPPFLCVGAIENISIRSNEPDEPIVEKAPRSFWSRFWFPWG